MKTEFFLIVFLSLFVGITSGYSQRKQPVQSTKPLNNPIYSPHNYKHPQAAAAARSWQNKPGVEVNSPVPAETQVANYKQQMPNRKPVGGIVVPHTPSSTLADRNYKIQRLSEPQRSPRSSSDYYVKQPVIVAKDTLVE